MQINEVPAYVANDDHRPNTQFLSHRRLQHLHSIIMEMKKIACAVLVAAAASLSAAVAADDMISPAPAPAPGPFPAHASAASLPAAAGSLLGASVLSLFALYLH